MMLCVGVDLERACLRPYRPVLCVCVCVQGAYRHYLSCVQFMCEMFSTDIHANQGRPLSLDMYTHDCMIPTHTHTHTHTHRPGYLTDAAGG